MDRQTIIERLTPIARRVFLKRELELTDEMDASSVDTWTSLSFMTFLSCIEDEFGFKFKIMELIKLQNIGVIVDTISNHCR